MNESHKQPLHESIDLERLVQKQPPEAEFIEFEFKITGMTCVACSGSIERLMHNEFDSKGMKSVAIVLLTHKMTAVFDANSFQTKKVTPEMICDEIDMIGFGAELNGMVEISAEDNAPNKKRMVKKDLSASYNSVDSARMRGDDESDVEIRSMATDRTSPSLKNSVMPVRKTTTTQIK